MKCKEDNNDKAAFFAYALTNWAISFIIKRDSSYG